MFLSTENEPLGTPLRSRGGVPRKHPTIAIDGPAASGKTTVGRILACRLGYRFLDTGVMYRTLAWTAMHRGVSLSDGVALGKLATSDIFAFAVEEGNASSEERDKHRKLYTAEVGNAASQVAQWPEVREALVKQQQNIAGRGSIVMVGRDIGTMVAPRADLKVFLVASAETRARRRMLQTGEADSFPEVLAHMEERDRRDTQRSHSPLIPADDARKLDTEHMDPEQVVEKIMSWLGDS